MKKKLVTTGLAILGSLALAVSIVGLAPQNVAAKMPYIQAAAIDPGSGNTDIYAMDTSGSGATVVVNYYPYNSTTPAGQKNVTLNAYGSIEILSSDGEVGLGDGFRGTVIVSSNAQVAVAAISKWSALVRAGAYRGFQEGAQTQYMPFLNYQPNVRDWSLAIFNVGSSDTTVTMTYFNRAGAQDFIITDNIPAGQQGYYDSAVGGAKVPTWTNSSYYNTNGYWTGGIKLEADGVDDRIVAVMTHHYKNYSGQYGSISSGDAAVYVPYVARRQIVGSRGRLVGSNLSIQNLSGATTVVTTTFVDNQTGLVSLVLNDTIPPYSLTSFHTIVGGQTHPRADFYPLDRYPPADSGTDEWVGSAIVESDGAELAVVATTIRDEVLVMGQYAASGQSAATLECFFPAGFRDENSGFYTNGVFNQIRLQNPGTTDATNVNFYFYDRDGSVTTLANWSGVQVDAGKSKSFLTKQPDASTLGTNWAGGIRVTSDQSLLCVTDVLVGEQKMSTYEGTGGP